MIFMACGGPLCRREREERKFYPEKKGKGVKRLGVYCIINCDLPIPFR